MQNHNLPLPDSYAHAENQEEPKASAIRLLIIGAGSRGTAYARAVTESTSAIISSVAEPIPFKREALGKKYIWANDKGARQEDQEFDTWQDFLHYETTRRRRQEAGERVLPGVDGVFVCVLDELHAEIITALAPLGLHVMSEKPLATTLGDCLRIYKSLTATSSGKPEAVFSIGHVLRYSPHNMLLRTLLLEEEVVGDIISIEHVEPVGWWHFSHSYVRGNWRKESVTAPSLLTKSCHDIDFILWMLCSPSLRRSSAHLPASVASTGSLSYFKKSRKPKLAGAATNCLSCPAEKECMYSAKKIYNERYLAKGNASWPVKIVDPEIEDCLVTQGPDAAEEKLLKRLAEDYTEATSQSEIDKRPWFGRCVYESGNDVCDDQTVMLSWNEETLPLLNDNDSSVGVQTQARGAKTASFHMIAFTENQCQRRGRVYGTKGEIEYDSQIIRIHDFSTGHTDVHYPSQPGGGHGGGDAGLVRQYIRAIEAVRNQGVSVKEAQDLYIGCSLEEVIRSHAMVFAAEQARREKKVIDWKDWWISNVQSHVAA